MPRSFKVCVAGNYSEMKQLQFSVPQGSNSAANLFTAYCESIFRQVPEAVSLHGFADDHFAHSSFPANSREAEIHCIGRLEKFFINAKNWMDGMRLKVNPDKTEFIMIGNQVQLNKTVTKSINACESVIAVSDTVRCLGTFIDKNLKFGPHIDRKCKAAIINFFKIKSVRESLTQSDCETLCLSLVVSHLDYCNSILIGVPKYQLYKMQRIQNMCCRLILNRNRYDSASQMLIDLPLAKHRKSY